jgi:hypothetical protein
VRQRTYPHASAHTNVQQRFVVSCHLNAYRFLDSFGVFSMQRREFLKTAATCGVAGTLPKAFGQQENVSSKSDPQEAGSMKQIPLTSSPGTLSGEMLYRTLGRTGERISAIGLGGFHIGKPSLTDDDSIRLIPQAAR